jgi:hypothetical protein
MAQWFILSLWLLTQKHPGLKTKIHSTWLWAFSYAISVSYLLFYMQSNVLATPG